LRTHSYHLIHSSIYEQRTSHRPYR
jgi:hypothetical protein